ncbi:hypothetical protein ETH_00025445 [Eimeria tenella]|uniref:Uncharacterized protein n=1 Tax=Eimeria tenella TaxID=5802 RepID=U6KQZ7_EIMTE|nr:hypothetical protein ETH_00025445 [Eimeria tenella]CDJ37828.1 hypothetical protein ETH_00025445 [Eimeria tenella]|eukprot:XP_013228666.1 hypothetical protein ETH_00025445 [Eimeria tenella]
MESLFQQQIDEVAFKDALYQQDIKYIARVKAMRRCFRCYEKKLTEDAFRSKNKKTRKRKLSRVLQRAEKIVYRKFGPDPKTPPPDAAELLRKVEVAESGFHPELVYVHSSLTQQQRREALDRLCGRSPSHLAAGDRWLLQSLLQTLRRNKPPIPLLLKQQYRLIESTGIFEVSQLGLTGKAPRSSHSSQEKGAATAAAAAAAAAAALANSSSGARVKKSSSSSSISIGKSKS